MAYTKKGKTATATTLTGLLLAGVIATALPANADENENSPPQSSVQLLNPLQDYSSQDYADAAANLDENTNLRGPKVEVESGTTSGDTNYTVFKQTISYTRYNADGENTVDTITNYSVESDYPSDPEVLKLIDDLKSEHDGSNNTYFMEPYDRTAYPGWQTRDGINQRNYVLARDLQDVEWNEAGTRVISGWHIDPFLGERRDFDESNISTELDIDHVLPLGHSWEDYHYKDRAEKGVFSNYDMNLLAVAASENRAKSDLSPAVYMPPNTDIHCDYALMWTHTSMTQDISLESQDIDILEDTLRDCVLNAVGEETEEMLENIEALKNGTLELSREEVENFITASDELSWDFSAQDVNHALAAEVDTTREGLLEAYDAAVNEDEEPSPEPTEPEPSEEPTDEPTPDPEPTDQPTEEEPSPEPTEPEESETPDPQPTDDPTDEPEPSEEPTENPEAQPEASLGTDTLEAGDTVFVNVLGFQADEPIEVTLGLETLAIFQTDEDGNVNDEVTIPADLAAGEYDLVITGVESGATVTLAFTVLEPAAEDTVIEAEAPQYNADDNTVVIPDVEGVSYFVDGEIVSGTLNIPENGLTVTVLALDGYAFSDDTVTEWVYTYVTPDTDEGENEIIEITAPKHNKEANTVTIPETEGLDYVVDGEIVSGTINIPENGLIVTVELHEGYSFVGTDNAPVWVYEYFTPQEKGTKVTDENTDNTNVINDTTGNRDTTPRDLNTTPRDRDTVVDHDNRINVDVERVDDTEQEVDENGDPVTISSGNTANNGGMIAGGLIALGSLGALAFGATRIRKAAHK